jgi:hypothetical protein
MCAKDNAFGEYLILTVKGEHHPYRSRPLCGDLWRDKPHERREFGESVARLERDDLKRLTTTRS